MKTICVLALGGTIAGSSQNATDASYKAGDVSVQTLLDKIPNLEQIAHLKIKQIANIGSQELDNATLLKLAKECKKAVDKKKIDGVLVLHGSDTLEESAYFVNLVVQTKKPIVFTASMRSGGALSSDKDMNIFNALSVATNKKARKKGVLVVLNDEIHHAREISKTNTTALNAFSSPNSGKIGSVNFGNVRFCFKSVKLHTFKSVFDISNINFLPHVDIVYSHFNDTSAFVRTSMSIGSKGIICAGLGNGNIYPKTLNTLHEASKKGVIVLRSSRVGSGIVSQKAEIDDETYGFLTSFDLNPQKARVLLQVLLCHEIKKDNMQKYFFKY